MRRFAALAFACLIPVGLALGLVACNSDGSLNAQGAQIIGALCKVDAAAQPVLVSIVPTLLPQTGPLASIDNAAVHPAVVKACANVGGTVVAAQTAQPSAVMPVAVVPATAATVTPDVAAASVGAAPAAAPAAAPPSK